MPTFADLHHGDGPFLLPNAWDVASALLLADAGFPAVATTSLGVTAAAGLPDGAGAGRDLTVALAGQLVPRLGVPLTVDLEGGYAEDPAAVAGLARQLADLGVAGINLEDGLEHGQLRTIEQHAAVIEAVAAATPELFINARTDTYWRGVGNEQERLDETVRRLAAYRDAGAAGVFVPGSGQHRIRAVPARFGRRARRRERRPRRTSPVGHAYCLRRSAVLAY
jgi:2-methylisocitrate lyase-like PEP mutase family enzyme